VSRQPRPEELVERLHKIEGQVRGVSRMVERGERCQDILTQVAAARAALAAVALGLLDSELHGDHPAGADAVLAAVERLVRL